VIVTSFLAQLPSTVFGKVATFAFSKDENIALKYLEQLHENLWFVRCPLLFQKNWSFGATFPFDNSSVPVQRRRTRAGEVPPLNFAVAISLHQTS
jgi:hypothetical protein